MPLRKVLELPEVYMSAQRWSELPYTRVASVVLEMNPPSCGCTAGGWLGRVCVHADDELVVRVC